MTKATDPSPEPRLFPALGEKAAAEIPLVLEATATFHRVDSFVPEGQEVVIIGPDTLATVGLVELAKRNFSQLPVVEQSSVLGVFSFRSYASRAVDHLARKVPLDTLNVTEFLEQLRYVQPTDDIDGVLASLVTDDAVLVGARDRLLAILTTSDVLEALYALTSAYLFIQEIELAIRKIVDAALTPDQFATCVSRSLGHLYKPEALPKTSSELTFGDYVQLFRNGDNWRLIGPIIGSTRELVAARLEPVNTMRNDIFHFKRTLAADERRRLIEVREWLFMRLTILGKQPRGGTA